MSNTEYTIDVNGRRYRLNEDFREAIETRARHEYEDNPRFSCWWMVADPAHYDDEEWENSVHERGDPILVIETEGPMVPWENLDQLEVGMFDDDDEEEEKDNGNGTVLEPDDDTEVERTHFDITPSDYEEVPGPQGIDPSKVPAKPESYDEPVMVSWVPEDPDLDHTWGAGEAITSVYSWVEWNVQKRADQPQPSEDKPDCHDRFESLCRVFDCEKVGEVSTKQDIPSDTPGSVERKGEDAFEDGRYGGGHWSV